MTRQYVNAFTDGQRSPQGHAGGHGRLRHRWAVLDGVAPPEDDE